MSAQCLPHCANRTRRVRWRDADPHAACANVTLVQASNLASSGDASERSEISRSGLVASSTCQE